MIEKFIKQIQTYPAATTVVAILFGAVVSMACTGTGVLQAEELHVYTINCEAPSEEMSASGITPVRMLHIRVLGSGEALGADISWVREHEEGTTLIIQRCPTTPAKGPGDTLEEMPR